MARVILDSSEITDWASFHRACKAAFGFPDFYGANMNAWIDCLTYLREDDGMSRFVLEPAEQLVIEVVKSESLPREILLELTECSAAVNRRYVEAGDEAPLRLVLQ